MHDKYMFAALKQAEIAFSKGEVPVGAIIVQDNQIVAQAYNQKEALKDPTAHAEIIALRVAAKNQNTWQLTDSTLYVTLEPCSMCAGALLQARIKRVVFGAMDAKAGAVGSVYNLLEAKRSNHQVEVIAGIMEEDCKEILQRFFKEKR